MVVWAYNPIREALVEHGYSFALLQSVGCPWRRLLRFPFVCFGNDSAAGFVVSCFSCRNLPTQFFALSAFVMLDQVITLDVEVVYMRTVLKYPGW
jgi:hypothetical protein